MKKQGIDFSQYPVFLILVNKPFKFRDIAYRKAAERRFLVLYPADVHSLICSQRNRNYIIAVEVVVENTGADCVAVQPYQQVEERRTVADVNDFLVWRGAQYFLRKVK